MLHQVLHHTCIDPFKVSDHRSPRTHHEPNVLRCQKPTLCQIGGRPDPLVIVADCVRGFLRWLGLGHALSVLALGVATETDGQLGGQRVVVFTLKFQRWRGYIGPLFVIKG